MSGQAAQKPDQKQALVLRTLPEIDFVEISERNAPTSHRSVHVDESFYFNPTFRHTIVDKQEKVDYIAFLVSPGRYFVTRPNTPSESKQYFTIRINKKKETKIGIYPENDVLPQDAQLVSEWPGPPDDLYNDIEKRVDLLENTSTRERAQRALPEIRKTFAEKDFQNWCKDPSTAVYIENDDETRQLLCPPKSA